MGNKKIIIAIDGYSSCGKSTFAKAIANRMGYVFIDTGAMYRAVTLYALENDIVGDERTIVEQLNDIQVEFRFNAELGRSEVFLNGRNVDKNIREQRVNESVSKISQITEVRQKLVEMQQRMGRERGVVMDGRDIGTVVFPDAELKIFMTADPHVRALRRFKEMGGTATLEEIERNVVERDCQDENRDVSPLKRADDAMLLDNSSMTVEEQMEWVESKIKRIIQENN